MLAAFRMTLRPPSAADDILRAQKPAVGDLDVDAGVVLREADEFPPTMDRHR